MYFTAKTSTTFRLVYQAIKPFTCNSDPHKLTSINSPTLLPLSAMQSRKCQLFWLGTGNYLVQSTTIKPIFKGLEFPFPPFKHEISYVMMSATKFQIP